MQDILGFPRQRLRRSPIHTPSGPKYHIAFALLLSLAAILVGGPCRAAQPEVSPEAQSRSVHTDAQTAETNLRQEQIEGLADELLEDMRKDGAFTPDTLVLNVGTQIKCTILNETASQYTISYNGLETTFPKGKVARVQSRSRENIEKELRTAALAKAARIIDEGLVRYQDEWITPDEKACRIMKSHMRSEAKRIDSRAQAEIEKAEEKAQSTRPDKRIRAPITVGADYGREIATQVRLAGKGTSMEITMVLDTGAAITCIRPDVAYALGLEEVTQAKITMADGRGSHYPIVRLEEVAIGGAKVQGLYAFVSDGGLQYAQGLLGADFLRHFEFTIDPQREVMFLKPR